MLVVGAVGMVPCVGWLGPFLTALLGIGGVMMSWFGTRTLFPRALTAPPAPGGPAGPPPSAA